MGKWNRRYMSRPRRSYYQYYQWSPPRDEPCPDPETEDWQDNVPMWEKKFCYLVGRMPWRKVLSTKNFMHCHNNVLNWDDSAGEEAFINAKKRFWEETNGLPCESQLPNPDMYIDEIDWNPYIDPELVRELDREYFNPDDKYYFPSARSTKANNGWPDDASNPWDLTKQNTGNATGWNNWNHRTDDGDKGQEPSNVQSINNWADDGDNCLECSSVKDRATGWDQWDNSVNDRCKSSKDDDPWESHCKQGNANGKNSTWAGAWHKSWDAVPQNQSGLSNNRSAADSNSWRNDGKRWKDPGANSRAWNPKKVDYNKPNYMNNNYKPWEYGPHHGSRVPNGRRNTWGKNQWENSNAWGQKHWDNYNWEPKDSSNNFRGCGHFNPSCKKRGADLYATNHKGPILHGADSQSNRFWNGANNKRVSFGGQWS